MHNPKIVLKEKDLIEIGFLDGDTNYSIRFRRDPKNPKYWPLAEKNTFLDAYTFKLDRPHADEGETGLEGRDGWSILEAKVKYDYYKWINTVKARKGRNTITVNLEESLNGPRSALLDFLRSYKESFYFWNYQEI